MILNEDGSLNEEKVQMLKEGKLFNSNNSNAPSSGLTSGSGGSGDQNQVVKTVKWRPGMPAAPATAVASQAVQPPPQKHTNLFSKRTNDDRGRHIPSSGFSTQQQQMWNPPDERYGMNMHMNQAYDPFQYNGGGHMDGPDMMMNMNIHGGNMNWGDMMNWGGYGGYG